jgi:hypothetical protein
MDSWRVTDESQESGTSDWFYRRSQTFARGPSFSFNDFRSFCCAVVTFSFFQLHPFLRYIPLYIHYQLSHRKTVEIAFVVPYSLPEATLFNLYQRSCRVSVPHLHSKGIAGERTAKAQKQYRTLNYLKVRHLLRGDKWRQRLY